MGDAIKGAAKDVGKEAFDKFKVEARNRACTEATNGLFFMIKDAAWRACTSAAEGATEKAIAQVKAEYEKRKSSK